MLGVRITAYLQRDITLYEVGEVEIGELGASCQQGLCPDEVGSRDLLGDGVLDLQPRVHFGQTGLWS